MIRSQNDIFIRTFDKIFHTEKKGIPQQNSLDGNIPRVLDAGQCNDSYSLVRIALKL
uniref:hypothetical protein n=1 Tax=Odoribacter splanchnicus TaxID=28118 RepID=UPI003A95478A